MQTTDERLDWQEMEFSNEQLSEMLLKANYNLQRAKMALNKIVNTGNKYTKEPGFDKEANKMGLHLLNLAREAVVLLEHTSGEEG